MYMKTFMSTTATQATYKWTICPFVKVHQKRLQNTIYIQNIEVDTNSSIESSSTGHNPMASSINSFYFAIPTSSSKALDLTSDPTDNFWHPQYHL